jgi:uncharacterized protein
MGLTPAELLIVALGFATAMLSGVAGMGGGTILMGALLVLDVSPTEAIPLFAAVQFTSNISRTAAYWPQVDRAAAGWFLLAAVPATWLTIGWVAHLEPGWIDLLLGALILLSFLPQGAALLARLPARLTYLTAGTLNGALGNVVGATGLFIGRLFLRAQWTRQTTVGTLALTQTLGHGLRVVAFGFAGLSALTRPGLLVGLIVAVMLGTAAGRYLNTRIDEAQYARLARGLLMALSLYLLTTGLIWLCTPNSMPPP